MKRLPEPRCGFSKAAFAFCLAVGAGLQGCTFDYGSPMEEEFSDDVPNFVMYDFRQTVQEREAPVMELSADKVEIFEKSKLTKAAELTYVEYERGTDAVVAEGRADEAVYHSDSGDAELQGNLRFSSPKEDFAIESPSLAWKDEARRLEGRRDQLTAISRSDGTEIKGSGFSADAATKTVSFVEHAEGTVVVDLDGEEDETVEAAAAVVPPSDASGAPPESDPVPAAETPEPMPSGDAEAEPVSPAAVPEPAGSDVPETRRRGGEAP